MSQVTIIQKKKAAGTDIRETDIKKPSGLKPADPNSVPPIPTVRRSV